MCMCTSGEGGSGCIASCTDPPSAIVFLQACETESTFDDDTSHDIYQRSDVGNSRTAAAGTVQTGPTMVGTTGGANPASRFPRVRGLDPAGAATVAGGYHQADPQRAAVSKRAHQSLVDIILNKW